MGGWADEMIQLHLESKESLLEVLRILENLEVHHSPGRERFWTPRETYQLWKAVYDAFANILAQD